MSCNIKSLVLSLLILAGFINPLSSQNHISGTINQYGRVMTIGSDFVILNSAAETSQFQAKDTIMLIQMKGVRIYAAEAASYGSSGTSYGQAGQHEFLTVQSVTPATKTIVFKNNIVNSGMNVAGRVQIVKVRSYNNALVDPAGLTCAVWDSTNKVGGVLAAIFKRKLTLNGNIDVSGKGFKGGKDTLGKGICIVNDPVKWNRYMYPASSDSSGYKGEGLAILADPGADNVPPYYPIYPRFAKGYGKNFNGGGGGNGKYSGGGGGSNYGAGGKGGSEIATCVPQYAGGNGGIQIIGTGLEGGLFLGGGGGATTNNGGAPTAGGNGGGIIILICDTLNGNGKSISASGITPTPQVTGNAGAGGGGGGGSIALSVQNLLNSAGTLTVAANGGAGGDNAGTFGEGGGGGGGYVNVKAANSSGTIVSAAAKGIVGQRAGTETGTDGAAGLVSSNFVPILNGFLFNSIISSANGSAIDSICSDIKPKKFIGTTPVGGSGNYHYEWLKSTTGSAPWTNVFSGDGAGFKDYAPGAPEGATFWIRRYVLDNVTALKDTSKAVKIVVQPAIAGNIIGNDTTICFGQNPLKLRHIGTPTGGYGNLHYHWLQNTTNNWSAYSSAVGTDSTKADFDPSALNVTTYYKRKINSGHCVDYSATTIKITVLPSITGNVTTRPDSVICEGSLFNALGASAAGGGAGAGSYTFLWQDSTATGNWLPASGTNSGTTYNPDTINFAVIEQRYYRRLVYSGMNNTCKSKSYPIQLTRYHKLENNAIGPLLQTICSGKIPAQLVPTLTITGGKTGTYDYQWHDSTSTATGVTGANSATHSPPALTATTWYWRVVNSSKCTSRSNKISVLVQPPITNNSISLLSGLTDSTICSGAIPKKLTGKIPPVLTGGDGSVYVYKWRFSNDNTNWSDAPGGSTSDYQQISALTANRWYKRVVSSGMCKDSVNSLKISVLPPVVNTIPVAKDVCINTSSTPPVIGLTLSGGRTNQYKFLWESSPDGITWANVTADTIRTMSGADLTLPLLSSPAKYRRKVWSGPYNTCFSASNILDISIIQKPYPVFAGRDTVIHTFEFLYRLRASQPVLGSGVWSVVSSPDPLTFDNETQYNTIVRNLSGFDPNVLLWTVTNGVCIIDTSVKITILNVEIPEGISPGNDGYNDLMVIRGLDFGIDDESGKPNQSIDLSILNSAGTEVFHTTNDKGSEWTTWDGNDNGGKALPEGTYYYLLKIKSNRSDAQNKWSGFIILKRR